MPVHNLWTNLWNHLWAAGDDRLAAVRVDAQYRRTAGDWSGMSTL